MNCQEAKIYLDEYMSGRLSDADKVRLDIHLKKCANCRKDFELEKVWLEIMQSDDVPDPGEKYWDMLESRILAQTFGAGDQTEPIREIEKDKSPVRLLRYVIPLAASILLFFLSTSGPIFIAEKQPVTISATEEIKNDFGELNEKLCLNIAKRPDILGTITMSPPGSLGRHMAIGALKNL